MAAPKKPPYVLYTVIAVVVIVALFALFLLAPVRRTRPTINDAQPTTHLSGGPVNGVGPSVGGNATGTQ